MFMMDSSDWNSQDPSMSAADDEFRQFLEMQGIPGIEGSLNLDYQAFANPSNPGHMEQVDAQMSGTDSASMTVPTTASMNHAHLGIMTTGPGHSSIQAPMGHMPPTPTDALNEIDAQIQYLQQQRLQQQQRNREQQQSAFYTNHNHRIPPTPRSLDIQAGNAHFFSPGDTPYLDTNIHHSKDSQQDMAFTPLVSPAVTPLEAHFNSDAAFALPPTYFSPLTSPALHAQNDPNAFYGHQFQQTALNTNSPIEMDLEPSRTTGSVQEFAKKARKASTSKPVRKTNVRQSPITKPQRRKPAGSSISNQVLSEAMEASASNRRQSLGSNLQYLRPEDTDENSSVSPEALSDMPPPPLPPPKSSSKTNGAASKSSKVAPKAAAPLVTMPSPATPASLMKLPSSSSTAKAAVSQSPQLESTSSDAMDTFFELPEAAADTAGEQMAPVEQMSSRLIPSTEPTANRTPLVQPMSSPAFVGMTSGTLSANQSPMLGPGASTPTARRTPQLAPRGSKQRTGSVTASPALLPKISPNIKPLLPGGPGDESAEDRASRLLTSKSNYQNILEGNKVPGITYPSDLSTNLTSKRTSHKLAEQGRRNRINSALQEIALLLPQSKEKDAKSGAEDAGGEGRGDKKGGDKEKEKDKSGTPGSKASTVEMAIEYIKQLKQEVADANRRADEAEKKLEMSKAGETS